MGVGGIGLPTLRAYNFVDHEVKNVDREKGTAIFRQFLQQLRERARVHEVYATCSSFKMGDGQ